jgi:hypothetical protein
MRHIMIIIIIIIRTTMRPTTFIIMLSLMSQKIMDISILTKMTSSRLPPGCQTKLINILIMILTAMGPTRLITIITQTPLATLRPHASRLRIVEMLADKRPRNTRSIVHHPSELLELETNQARYHREEAAAMCKGQADLFASLRKVALSSASKGNAGVLSLYAVAFSVSPESCP